MLQILQNAPFRHFWRESACMRCAKAWTYFQLFCVVHAVGLKTAVQIPPVMVGMLTVVFMLRASGAVDIAASVLAPALRILGIPKECTALTLLKPISGGGGLAMGSEIIYDAADRTAMPDAWPQ